MSLRDEDAFVAAGDAAIEELWAAQQPKKARKKQKKVPTKEEVERRKVTSFLCSLS